MVIKINDGEYVIGQVEFHPDKSNISLLVQMDKLR